MQFVFIMKQVRDGQTVPLCLLTPFSLADVFTEKIVSFWARLLCFFVPGRRKEWRKEKRREREILREEGSEAPGASLNTMIR